MNTPSPPPAPDPVKTAQAQSDSNKATAITQYGLNATNQVTPYGNLTYSQNGTWSDGTPRFTATQTLSPEQQKLFDLYTQNQTNLGQIGLEQTQKVGNLLNTPFDLNSSVSNQQADIQRKLLDPTWDARQKQFDAQMRDRGIVPGSEAYTNAARDFGMQRDNAYNSALLASRGQATQEALAQRNQPLNEVSALMSGSQVSQPNFIGTPQTTVAPTDVLGAYALNQNAQNVAYQGQVAQNNALYGALGSIGGAATSMALGGWGGFGKPK